MSAVLAVVMMLGSMVGMGIKEANTAAEKEKSEAVVESSVDSPSDRELVELNKLDQQLKVKKGKKL